MFCPFIPPSPLSPGSHRYLTVFIFLPFSCYTVRIIQYVPFLDWLISLVICIWASLVAQMVKNLPAMWEIRVQSESGRSPGEGNGNPLQYSCLENPMDRGAWQATVHGAAKRQTGQYALKFPPCLLTAWKKMAHFPVLNNIPLSQCFTSEESNLDHDNS